ncbi:MAG: hypothetical protein ABH882_06995 [Candidatus Omnitrophota bacterium]
MAISKKTKGFKMKLKTFEGGIGTYLFMKDPAGSYHAFVEVDTKKAIRDCGIKKKGTTRQLAKHLLDF